MESGRFFFNSYAMSAKNAGLRAVAYCIAYFFLSFAVYKSSWSGSYVFKWINSFRKT